MKRIFALLIAVTSFCSPLFSQTFIDSKDTEMLLSAGEFSDAVKKIWDVVKVDLEEYDKTARSKDEFETSADFQKKLAMKNSELTKHVHAFAKEVNLAKRYASVLMKATLVKYDADKMTYGLKSPDKILIPPTNDRISLRCSPNSFVSIYDVTEKAYKFSYLILNTNPEFTWYVEKEMAQEAKANEAVIFFKVWFSFELTQIDFSGQSVISINPVKIALINNNDSMEYWKEEIR